MSLQGLNDLDVDWTLRNTLTINNDVVVEGDLNTTGFIYDGGIPLNIQSANNVWTAENTFTNYPPTYLQPANPDEMATKLYADTTFAGAGSGTLPTNNVWTGSNVFQGLPTISNLADAGNELVNKSKCDTTISGTTGNLATNNTWTGTNAFQNALTIPNPTLDAQIATKGYTDNAVSTFNSTGGKVEFVEMSSSNGAINISLDPTIYSSMIVCMVSPGGFGNANTTTTGQTIKSFGGSGGYACFKMPAYNGNCVFTTNTGTRGVSVGSCSFTLPSGAVLVSITGGTTGSATASGTGGVVTTNPSITGVQVVPGSVQTLQNPQDPTIYRVANIAVWNGFGIGGSFDFQTGTDVLPTDGYVLCIKFKN